MKVYTRQPSMSGTSSVDQDGNIQEKGPFDYVEWKPSINIPDRFVSKAEAHRLLFPEDYINKDSKIK